MRYDLKDFQKGAVALMLEEISDARDDILRRHRDQAIVLSSPTGSGKTITMAAVIEGVLYGGDDGLPANPDAVFLWFSDSPELNNQSCDKISRASDLIPARRLVVIDSDFDEQVFAPGSVYFLNTQKLARTSLLVRQGDERKYTIWETIRNSINRSPENFFLVIDEAHRGMTAPADLETARTIVQKFIIGGAEIPAVPLVLGMSATPQRFDELIGATVRTRRPVPIDPAEVRESGLLKDRVILFHPGEGQPSDFSLLTEATRSWRSYTERWEAYCRREAEPELVRPMLVIQVQDGTAETPTRTDLSRLIRAVREAYPDITSEKIAHAFEDDGDLLVEGVQIRKAEASKLQDMTAVEIVLFKRSLTTGWDCPRAEVIMSFRRAVDETMIAQLVGRMVRSPLARRIEGDDALNGVELYLPYYDEAAVDSIIRRLSAPDPLSQMPVQAERRGEGVDYPRAGGLDEAVEAIESLPSYRLSRAPKQSEVKRALRLSFLLTARDGLDVEARDEALNGLLETAITERDRIAANDDFARRIMDTGEIELREVTYDFVTQEAVAERPVTIAATEENINDLFRQMGRRIAPGEGLHEAFWRRTFREDEPLRSKIEFIVTAQDPAAIVAIERAAEAIFDRLYDRNRLRIMELPEREMESYSHLQGVARTPKTFPLRLPDVLHERRGRGPLSKHLYRSASGEFEAPLNSWEMEVLAQEVPRDEIVAWLRNQDRKPWSVCIPFEDRGHMKGFYPDFIFIRTGNAGLEVDLVEPHDMGREDSWKKAKGMAVFADQHGGRFGRLLLGMLEGDRLLMANANERRTRDRMRALTSNDDLRNLILNGP